MFYAVFMCFSHYLDIQCGGGGGPKELVHNLHTHLFTLGNSKIEVFKTYFLDTVAIVAIRPT